MTKKQRKKMKKMLISILTSAILITPSLMAEANIVIKPSVAEKSDFYIGIDYFTGSTNMDLAVKGDNTYTGDADFDTDGFRLKFGVESEDDWRVQGYIKSEDMQDTDDNNYGIGVDIIKGFAVTPKFSPFIQAGVGIDWTSLGYDASVIYDSETIQALHLKLGLGAMYKITDTVEILGGFDWQFRSWQDIEVIDGSDNYTMEFEDIGTNFYIGLNFHI